MSDRIPRELHNLRACMLCHLIKSADQFEKNGCENCEKFIQMRQHRDLVAQCTTAVFSGMIALCNPEDSWVARWQRMEKRVKGMYAIDVSGKLPYGLVDDLKHRDIDLKDR